ncbi:CRISPR-associated helicase Cas3' [Corynebacterium sp.]|uniref:CRISPR-associated helicase Cas3' n=1 Tax=Corynebacterium sp. TaxID=1720 RepID=UPI0035A0E457
MNHGSHSPSLSTLIPARAREFCMKADGWAQARSRQAQSLWAKSGNDTDFLTLPQHMVDSACAASFLFNSWLASSVKRFLSGALGVDERGVEVLYTWLAGCHDIGKAVRTFQRMLLESDKRHLVYAVADAGLDIDLSVDEMNFDKLPHGVVSGEILSLWLCERGVPQPKANALAAVVNAHHGIANKPSPRVRELMEDYPEPWRVVQCELLDAMTELCDAEDVLAEVCRGRKLHQAVVEILTGLVVMADWVASNENAFTLHVSGTQLERVEAAAASIDVTPPWEPDMGEWGDIDKRFQHSFGWPEEYHARPVQRAVVEAVQNIDGPTLVVIEAETGVGKTEAGLAAAEILAARSGAQGVFFAAPTMATANGLLERTMEWAAHNTADSVRSMYLAHSKNALSEPYRQLKFSSIGPDSVDGGRVIASQWMSGRRLGLLSNFVVGTVDQVLMMALQQRFHMLRHVGLAGKVIIFDEVHAFDAYTSDYLRRTIEWLGYYGASVILMSATLPPDKRRSLVQAYSQAPWPDEEPTGYPLLTLATKDAVQFRSVPSSPTNLEARIDFLDDAVEHLVSSVQQNLDQGGCALIICNTIARAQEAFRTLEEVYGDEVQLHHAGFVAWERVAKEDALRAELGPDSHRGSGRPWRKIVVATQVAEQSLDIDADLLITDIAPMDLIIQRIGRLHRHARPESDRPDNLRQPRVLIRGIVHREPVPEFDSGAEYIYGTALLLSTLANLPSVFRRPDDIEGLVRAAYDRKFTPPAGWEEAWAEAQKKSLFAEGSAHSKSSNFQLPSPRQRESYDTLFSQLISDDAGSGDERGAAQVRDAEPAVEVIPIQSTDYGYRPWGREEEILEGAELSYKDAFRLASSTVRLPVRMTRCDSDFNDVVGVLEDETPEQWRSHFLLCGQLALRLNDSDTAELGRFMVSYSSDLGIEILSEGSK